MWKRILFVVFILFCIELGLFLLVLPWSEIWERNLFLSLFPELRAFLLSNYFRGALTGLGLVNLWVGLSDAWHFRENLALLEKQERQPGASGRLDPEAAAVPRVAGDNDPLR